MLITPLDDSPTVYAAKTAVTGSFPNIVPFAGALTAKETHYPMFTEHNGMPTGMTESLS
jgi:hypothetical protein